MGNVWSLTTANQRTHTHGPPARTTYYVATLARYVLVDAASEAEGRTLGQTALYDLYADLRERLGKEVPITIQLCRPATDEEIAMMRRQNECLAREMPRG
jgi:hypothetical protein